MGIVKSEPAKGLILERKKKKKMMMMMMMMMVVVVVVVVVLVVAMYHLLLFFHVRPAKHHTIMVVTLCLSDAHDLGSWFLRTVCPYRRLCIGKVNNFCSHHHEYLRSHEYYPT
jgi:hypothetical protein